MTAELAGIVKRLDGMTVLAGHSFQHFNVDDKDVEMVYPLLMARLRFMRVGPCFPSPDYSPGTSEDEAEALASIENDNFNNSADPAMCNGRVYIYPEIETLSPDTLQQVLQVFTAAGEPCSTSGTWCNPFIRQMPLDFLRGSTHDGVAA
ncbi:hypothetical protein CYMTET_39041 [Cymbomonas tetramitiformis]|uniref:Uncharacterized protein n=1 Tax=Cymbomonas tetramitiformis TaxID=36881 RepID=A0AAE0CD22_9CHLO|nr:hypothetical protein CYMTET_39041 [Cymbomonas tetramitiformis]